MIEICSNKDYIYTKYTFNTFKSNDFELTQLYSDSYFKSLPYK